MKQGWIKLYRKLQEKGYYKKSQYVHLWVHLLLSANHEKKEFMWNKEIIIIKEGQLLTGRDKLAEETGINRSTIENILKLLENEHQIEQQKTTKFRVITILNWKTYQTDDKKSSNRVATKEQQSSTNKNVKNDNNEKNNTMAIAIDEIPKVINLFKDIDGSYKEWFANTTERGACEKLLIRCPLDKLEHLIRQILPVLNSMPYNTSKAKAFKPSELNRNWAAIMAKIKEKQIERSDSKFKILK